MIFIARIGLLASLVWAGAAAAQSAQWLVVGKNAFAFHDDTFRDLPIKVEPPAVADAEIFVELIGIPNFAKINALRVVIQRANGLNTASAFISQDFRLIAYDPNWSRVSTAEFYLVIGHEAGHHFCEHTIGEAKGGPWEKELEADRFGGASIKRFEAYRNRPFFAAVLAAALSKYPEQGSTIHPPRALRIEALKKGYEQGSPCGGLAPVEQVGAGGR